MKYDARSIAVYCGASKGLQSDYLEHAAALGNAMAARGISLIFGGGSTGMMGAVADAVLKAGGQAVGVVPTQFDWAEITHRRLTQLHMVANMHERKALMVKLADAFVALPGGYGTWEELLEVVTWAQLGLHSKPIVIYNVAGYYDGLLLMIKQGVEQGFVPVRNQHLLMVAETAESVLDLIANYEPHPYYSRVDELISDQN